MKKNITLLTIILLGFLIFGAEKSLAYTASECAARGGGCSNSPCNGSANTIGGCDGTAAPYCCGNASAATQQIFGSGSPTGAATTATGGGNLSASFANPIGWSSIEQVMNSLAGYLKGIAGTIAVIFIIIGGIMYMFAGANKDMAEKGKHTLTYAIAGLAIVIAAPTFLREIKTILGGDTSGIGGLSLLEIAGNVLRLLLSIVGMLAIIMMVIGGIWMFSAAGNEKQYETGRSIVTYAIIGLAIAIGSLVIAQQVANLIGGGAGVSMSGGSGSYGVGGSTPIGYSGGISGTGGIIGSTGTTMIGPDGSVYANNSGIITNYNGGSYSYSSPIKVDSQQIRFDQVNATQQIKVTFDSSITPNVNTNSSSGSSSSGLIDITKTATYTSSDISKVTVSSDGLVKSTYTYKDGDPSPVSATIQVTYQGYSTSIPVEIIDRSACVPVYPTDAKYDDQRIPIILTSAGFSDKEANEFKKEAEEYAKVEVWPSTTDNYVLWRSDRLGKDACNFPGSANVILENKEDRSYADYTSKTVHLFYASDGDVDNRSWILSHELGHMEGNLDDEYTEEGKNPWDFYENDIENCFHVENSLSEKMRLQAGCDYFKGISQKYDCGVDNANIFQGCEYEEGVDDKGYDWYRSVEEGMMGGGMYYGAPYGAVGEALYVANLKRTRGFSAK